MRCVIPGKGIRAFGKAIFCLGKIGDEMFLEALSDGLALKTVNSARSAYACFVFNRKFFNSFSDGRSRGETDEESLKCKISIKSCVSVFKALSTLEKTVDRFTLELDVEESKLVFVFHCKHGIVKTHNLGFQESEAVQAVFNKDLCPNHIAGSARIISEVVTNFPTNLDEVTMIAEPEGVRLQNYVDDEGDGGRVSLTEISLMPSEFDQYQVGVDVALTFCLKELRAILLFTDAINHDLSFRFEGAGKPVVISIDDTQEYQADFVLATLLGGESESQSVPTSVSSASKAAHHSTSRQRTTASKRVQNGLHSNGTDTTDQSNLEQDDSSVTTNSHSESVNNHTRQQLNKMGRTRNAGGGGGLVTRRSAEDMESNFPTGSQFGTSSRRRGETRTYNVATNASSSNVNNPSSHIPPPPSDNVDFMDVESLSTEPVSQRHTTGLMSKERTPRTTSLHSGVSNAMPDDDFMDALFEAENLHDVADEGSMFGLGCQQTGDEMITRTRASKDNDRSATNMRKQKGLLLSEESMDTDLQEPLASSQTDSLPSFNRATKRSALAHSTPASGQWPNLAVAGREDGGTQGNDDLEPTQDSIINDSGFIPSTPPAKKFKSMPVLYGMDMFGGQSDMSQVLAPDSEDEDEGD